MSWRKQRKVQIFFLLQEKKENYKNDKDCKERIETMSYSMRLMGTSLTKLVNNLMKGLRKTKCKDCGCWVFEYEIVKDI